MKKALPWQMVLLGYKRSPDPAERARCRLFYAAIGLQGVDGLNPSDYFVSLAEKNIQGLCSYEALEEKLCRYYRRHSRSQALTEETREADLVSLHIVQLLSQGDFSCSVREIQKIHHFLFRDVYDFAGDFRNYDIRKKEWILEGESVCYTDWEQIPQALSALLEAESRFRFRGLTGRQIVDHLAEFISALWLIHPYGEGNTRTTALFLLRYLQSLGILARKDVFLDSWYFRNALVRANYSSGRVQPDRQYLKRFLENLLLRKDHPLRSQELHLKYPDIPEST